MGLGDALKKAGLVDDKDLRRAKREKKREQIDAGLLTRRDAEEQLEAERIARQDEEARRRDEQRRVEEERSVERARRELRIRIGQIAARNDLTERRPGREPFHFVTRNRKIRRLLVTPEMASKLRSGAVAIVERPEPSDSDDCAHAIVDRPNCERIRELDADAVRFDAADLA